MAAALAGAGADVVLHASSAPPEAAAADIAARTGRRTHALAGDLRNAAAGDRVVADAVAAFGRVDIVVNNAGTIRRQPAAEHDDAFWDEVLAVNLSSVFRLCRAAGRHMLARGGGGKIVNIASLLSFQGGITVPGYAAAKGGVAQLTKALANEWAAHGINVNAIAPGYMETDNTAALRADADARAPDRRAHSGRPLGPARGPGRRGRVPGVGGVGLRPRPRAGRRRRLDGSLRTPMPDSHRIVPRRRHAEPRVHAGRSSSRKLVGPAALTAAGMIGAGAVATRLLAGAWFGFDLLWVALADRADGDRHARLGVARRHPLGRPRHDRHGAHRHRRVARLGHRRADGAGQRRRQHEPDVGDGRGHLRRARHAAAGQRRLRAGRRGDRRAHRHHASSPPCSAATSASRRS